MNDESKHRLYERFEWISYQLEREAYLQQMKGRKMPLKQFIPCNKALVFTHALDVMGTEESVTMVVIPKAALTQCNCHNSMGEQDIWKLYDEATKIFPYKTNQESQ